jgi:hypothetical protein
LAGLRQGRSAQKGRHRTSRSKSHSRLERLEARQLLAVDVGWSQSVNDFTVSYEYVDSYQFQVKVAVYGTNAADVIHVADDPSNPSAVRLNLNGVDHFIDAREFRSDTVFEVYGRGGNDVIVRHATTSPFKGCYLNGGDGDDLLIGGAGNDAMTGGAGNDTVFGNDGDDYVGGGTGDDLVFGGRGNDNVSGSGGNSVLWGGAGDDTLSGGGGNDEMHGGAGNDRFYDGVGADTMWGGDGVDTFNDVYIANGTSSIRGLDADDQAYGGPGMDFIGWGYEASDASASDPVEPQVDEEGLLASLKPELPPQNASASAAPAAAMAQQAAPQPPAPAATPSKRELRQQAKQTRRVEHKRLAQAARVARREALREVMHLASLAQLAADAPAR